MILKGLAFLGRQAKWVLAAGLVCGALLPGLASLLSNALVPLICIITFTGALRLQPSEMRAVFGKPIGSLLYVAVAQLVVPLGLWTTLHAMGLSHTAAAMGAVVVLSAPTIISSSNIAGILNLDAAAAMRLAVWTTCLVPLTSIPAMIVLFGSANIEAVFQTALRLALIIVFAGGLGFLVRLRFLRDISSEAEARIDGASALSLGIFVVSLMPALRTTFQSDPVTLGFWILFAFALNFGTQILVWWFARDRSGLRTGGAYALAAGNRNFALFFAALPPAETAQFLTFLAAYQLPMFLTPLLLKSMYDPTKTEKGR